MLINYLKKVLLEVREHEYYNEEELYYDIKLVEDMLKELKNKSLCIDLWEKED